MGRIKRFLVSLPLAVALFVMGTGSVWAVAIKDETINESEYPLLNADTHTVGPLKTDGLGSLDLELVRDFLKPDSINYYVCAQKTADNVPIITIMKLPLDRLSELTYIVNENGYYNFVGGSARIKFSALSFRADTGVPVQCGKSGDLNLSPNFFPEGNKQYYWGTELLNFAARAPIYYGFLSETNIKTSDLKYVWRGGQPGSIVKFIFEGINDTPPTPSEPDPPPTPSYPDFPTIGPTDNEYVPYDTTVWNKFLDFIKGRISAAVPVGLLVFAVIMGILICIRIVRKFTKG